MATTTFFKFLGNIENDNAICNVSENCQFSTKPTTMTIPAQYCTEVDDTIIIDKKVFNRLKRANVIKFN